MDPATPIGETQAPTDPKTNATPAPTPVVTTPDPAIEELRKKAEQAEMRANQLANQLKAKDDAEAAAKAKELEDQNKYKDLYEQEKARREEVETAKENAEQAAQLKTEQDKVFSEYPDEVKNLAAEVGLGLTDTDEDTVTAFKAKLDKISGSIKAPKVTPNNPGTPPAKTDLAPQDMHTIANDPVKFAEYMKQNSKGVASMMRPAV